MSGVGLAKKYGLMAPFLRESTGTIKRMARASLDGPMVTSTWASLETTGKTGKESWNIAMAGSIRDNGLMTKCMGKASLFGPTAKAIEEATRGTKSTGWAKWCTRMGVCTRVTGAMGRSREGARNTRDQADSTTGIGRTALSSIWYDFDYLTKVPINITYSWVYVWRITSAESMPSADKKGNTVSCVGTVSF